MSTWKSDPHEPIEELSPGLWRIEGPLPRMQIRRVMTVAKRNDDDLVIHSAIRLEASSMERLQDFGRPAYLVVPNGFHRLAAPSYAERYPDIQVVCPAGARKRVEERVRVDMTYEDFPADEAVELIHLAGVKEQEGVMLVRAEDGVTLVFNDAIFNAPHGTGIAGFIFRHITASTGGPRVSRLFKLAVVKDRDALRKHLEELADTEDLCRIIVSHQNVIEDAPARALRQVAATL